MDNKKRLKWARHSNPLQASAMFLPSPVLTDRFNGSKFTTYSHVVYDIPRNRYSFFKV